MSNKSKISLPKAGDWIEITARRCGEKQSPLLEVGTRFVTKGIDELKDGTPVIEVMHPKRRKATLRVSTDKFSWKTVSLDDMEEERFKKDVSEDSARLAAEFSKKEQTSIAFVPLIINHMAWNYVMKAVRISVDNRIDILKKVTRAVRKLRQDYADELAKDLDLRHQEHIESEAERFMGEFGRDFTILYFSVNQEFKRKMPTFPYGEMRTYSIIAMLMIRLADEHNRSMDTLIRSRLGHAANSIRMPVMDALYSCMDAYAGEVGRFDFNDRDIRLATKIIYNKLISTGFDIL